MAANIFCGVRSLLALQMLLKKESTKQEEEGLVYMSITALIFNCVHLVYLVYIYIYIPCIPCKSCMVPYHSYLVYLLYTFKLFFTFCTFIFLYLDI